MPNASSHAAFPYRPRPHARMLPPLGRTRSEGRRLAFESRHVDGGDPAVLDHNPFGPKTPRLFLRLRR